MDSLKHPGTVLSTVSLVGLLGTSAYFYKKLGDLEEELNKFSDVVVRMDRAVNQEESTKVQLESVTMAVRKYGQTLGEMKEIMDSIDLATKENERKIRAILERMEEEGMEVDLKKKRRSKKGKKVVQSEEEDDSGDDSDDYLEDLKKKKKK
ncbi:Transmembrane domain-containing protein [Brazilian cedratvirus IHUMI]|uniref:Transmembrane domain-containing protein n=1 Tax=Brazilian cedratvirus IHUMI TaxID=2126980 RepID=A0A2R8FEA4_9VIRU|nr:Transmembrane domain-containing protein [Brazilian cedratvirus IHUMI]